VTRRLRQPRTVKTDRGFSAEFEIFFVLVRDSLSSAFYGVPDASGKSLAPGGIVLFPAVPLLRGVLSRGAQIDFHTAVCCTAGFGVVVSDRLVLAHA
jgi:hypothetical protein